MRFGVKTVLVAFLGLLSHWYMSDVSARAASSQEASDVSAQNPPTPDDIFGTGWGMTLALDGTGFYNDVIGLVLKHADQQKAYLPLPYRRAKVEFENGQGSCLYPSNIEHLARGGEINTDNGYIQTAPLVWVESHIFSRPGTPALKSLAALEGARVAYPNGSALPVVLAEYGADFIPTTDETTKARMLVAGRVGYMSGSLPDNVFVFRELGVALPPYNPDLALIRVGVSVVCHDTPANQTFVSAFDAALAAVMTSGDMANLYEAAGVEARFIPAPRTAR